MKKRSDEINELAKHGRIRNRLLTAKTMQAEVRAAAERVMRLSNPGTPERLLTLAEVERETGVKSTDIVREIQAVKRVRRAPRETGGSR